ARKEAIKAETSLGYKFCATQILNPFGCTPSGFPKKSPKKPSSRFKKSKSCLDCASKPFRKSFKPRRKFFRRKKFFPKARQNQIECYICKGNHYSRDCPQKGKKASAKAKVSFALEHSVNEDEYILVSDTKSYESDIEFSNLTIAANQALSSSSEEEFSDSDPGYESLPSFHCSMIRSSYEHPYIAPSSIVLKKKLDSLKKELFECPPHMVSCHYSLQLQIHELTGQLNAKILQENAEDNQLAARRAITTPTTSFAPYHFSLPSERGRG
ncbi:hypothetical protein KI387_013731, partial [Taxus chinensis]